MRVPYSGINQTDQTLSSRLGLGTFLIKLTCLRQPWKPVGKILNPTCTPTRWASICWWLMAGYWLMHLRSWEYEILSERKNSSVQISNFRASSREEPRHGEERNSEVSRGSEKCQSLSSHCPPAGAQRRPTCQWMILDPDFFQPIPSPATSPILYFPPSLPLHQYRTIGILHKTQAGKKYFLFYFEISLVSIFTYFNKPKSTKEVFMLQNEFILFIFMWEERRR